MVLICQNLLMAGKNKDYHKKLYRLVRILNRLETEGKVSPGELADEFNVSLRTAQRDLELIDMAEFPLVSMDKGNYSFMPGFSLKKLPLSAEEASLLAFMCEIGKAMGGDFEDSFKSLHAKVLLTGGISPLHAIMPVTPKEDCPTAVDIRAAVDECRKVEIHYSNGKTYRLSPLKIVYSEGFWYVLAQIEGRRQRSTFRLDRIKRADLLPGTFVPPKNLDKILKDKTSIWFGEKPKTTVLMRIAPEAARYFQAAVFFPEQKIKRVEKGGALIVESRVSHFMEVIPVILKWMPHITVLKPKSLRDEIRERVRAYGKII